MQSGLKFRGSSYVKSMETFSYILVILGIFGLALTYSEFPSIPEFRLIRNTRKRILGLNPYLVFLVSAHILVLGLAIQIIYFLFPNQK